MSAPDLVSIGIDPGPTPGVVALVFAGSVLVEVDVFQCTANKAVWLVGPLGDHYAIESKTRVVAQIERFVHRGRMNTAQQTTAAMVAELREALAVSGVLAAVRSASAVKPWATDERLDAVGLLATTKGMRHARDAARHALFAAVRDGGYPDPLSSTERTTP